jgi:hypothetical protein
MLTDTVQSTTLATIRYDATHETLWLEFRNRAVYCYFGVPATVQQALLEAHSKGAYFNRHIRDRFAYQKVVNAPPVHLPTTTPCP